MSYVKKCDFPVCHGTGGENLNVQENSRDILHTFRTFPNRRNLKTLLGSTNIAALKIHQILMVFIRKDSVGFPASYVSLAKKKAPKLLWIPPR